MKQAEKESFLKGFFVFFFVLVILATFLAFLEYNRQKYDLDNDLFNQMKICSFDLKCQQFEFDFVPFDSQKDVYKFLIEDQGAYALFPLPQENKYTLKLIFSSKKYDEKITILTQKIFTYYVFGIVFLACLSALFSWYALLPLRRALQLTEEFSRDMLHDLNTPIAALKLNLDRLQGLPTEERKIMRMKQSVEAMLSLSRNLQSYLEEHPLQVETIHLYSLLQTRIEIFQKIYPKIKFQINSMRINIQVNPDAFVRIIDNVLSNAAKYNAPNGSVFISFDNHTKILFIQDSGKGVQHPNRVFERFYKEQDRGLGIGLHIVKKLCDEMKIGVILESHLERGTVVKFNLVNVLTQTEIKKGN